MKTRKAVNHVVFVLLCILIVLFLTPIFFIILNSFKGKLFISDNPFALPTAETFACVLPRSATFGR